MNIERKKFNADTILAISTIILLIVLIIVNSIYTSKLQSKKEYILLGDSITSRYNTQLYYPKYPIINSGIGGDKTEDILNNLENRIYKYQPNKIILLIGINDLTHWKSSNYISKNIDKITNKIHNKYPDCEIYIQSIYPVNNQWKNTYGDSVPNLDDISKSIVETNKNIQKICKKNKYHYIDIYKYLADNNGMLLNEYSFDGIHVNEKAYKLITKIIKNECFSS